MAKLDDAFIDRDWAKAESLANDLLSMPATLSFIPILGHNARASALASRGELARAEQENHEAARSAAAAFGAVGEGMPIALAMPDLFWGRVPPPPPPNLSRKARDLTRALHAAWAGDSTGARRALIAARSSASPRSVASVSAQVEGTLRYRQGRWQEAIDLLAPHARIGRYIPGSAEELRRQVSRWFVADAFVHQGRPDSAVAYLDLMLDPPGHPPQVMLRRGTSDPFVRNRLVRIYAQSGRIDEARRQWDTLSAMVTRPDPAIRAMVDETHALLQSAEGMRATARR